MTTPRPTLPTHEFELSDPARLVPDPDVSVTVITYNHSPYLAQALDSVLAQRTRFGFEIVIAEDGSTDDTRAIAFDYQRRRPEIVRVLYSRANVGMGANVERALAACRGRYLANVDGDDFWDDPDRLEAQLTVLEARPDINIAFSRGYRLMPDGSREPGWDYGPSDRIVRPSELLRTPGMTVPTASLVGRADVILGSPEWIYRAPVMDLFHLLAAAYPNGAYYLARETVAYRVTSLGSWTSGQNAHGWAQRADHARAMLKAFALAEASFGIPHGDLRFVRSLPHYVLGRVALSERKPGLAMRHFRQVGGRYAAERLREIPGKLRRALFDRKARR